MARKKPEAVRTLEAIRPACACGATAILRNDEKNLCGACDVMRVDAIARKRVIELGLDMRQDETREAWRKRVFAHLRRMGKVKTFADAGKAEDEWAA